MRHGSVSLLIRPGHPFMEIQAAIAENQSNKIIMGLMSEIPDHLPEK